MTPVKIALFLFCIMLSMSALAQMPEDAPILDKSTLDTGFMLVNAQAPRFRGLSISRVPAFPATREECTLWENKANDWETGAMVFGGLSGGSGVLAAALAYWMGKRKGAVISGVAFLGLGIMTGVSAFKSDTYGDRHYERCTVDVSLKEQVQ